MIYTLTHNNQGRPEIMPIDDLVEYDKLVRLGNFIRRCRKMEKRTLQSVADAVGTSKSYIHEIEAGKSNMSFKIAAKIASELNIEIGALASYHTRTK